MTYCCIFCLQTCKDALTTSLVSRDYMYIYVCAVNSFFSLLFVVSIVNNLCKNIEYNLLLCIFGYMK